MTATERPWLKMYLAKALGDGIENTGEVCWWRVHIDGSSTDCWIEMIDLKAIKTPIIREVLENAYR
jgi:hypothetical protein